MARQIAGMMFEEAVEYTLRQIEAFGPDSAVPTKQLAKAMRRLGFPAKRDIIAEKLHQHRRGAWGRRYAFFIGGTQDEMEAFLWAIPKGE